MIYNCLGSGTGSESFADFREFQLIEGDTLLLCSDGLSDTIDDGRIEEIMNQTLSPSVLIEAAKEAGGYDNVSVIILQAK